MPRREGLQPIGFLTTPAVEDSGQFSPNGRWIAYRTTEAGQDKVSVQGVSRDGTPERGKWQVSTTGGTEPRWRKDGKELYYVAESSLMAVDVRTDAKTFEAGVPRRLFAVPVPAGPARNRYLPTRDGQRFLVNLPLEPESEARIQVLVNWLAQKP